MECFTESQMNGLSRHPFCFLMPFSFPLFLSIVFILVDNVAGGISGCTIPTPRIDKLASESIRFNNDNGQPFP